MGLYGTNYFIIESKNNILPKSDLYKVYKNAKKVMKINGINVMFMEDGIDYKSEEKIIKQLISEEDWISSINDIVNDESDTEILYKNASNKQYYVEYFTEDECTYYVSFKCNNKDSKYYGKNIVIMTKRLESVKSVWIESTLLNESVLSGPDEPENLYKYLKKVYKPSDFKNLTEESIQNDIQSKRKIDLQKEWIQYSNEWIDDENDTENAKVLRSKIKRMEKLQIVMIWNDGGGTELGYDLNSKKIFCFDHDYGFINSSITIKQAISLSK